MNNWWENRILHWVLVLVVFAITGSSIARLDTYLTLLAGYEKYSWFWWVMLVVLLPVYSLLLLGVAFVFGKFQYFRAKQMKMWRRIFPWLRSKNENPDQNA